MLLDLLRTDEYVSFNKKLAHIIGLESAIYINQVINIMGKAIKKDKLVDGGYIIIDRKYIYDQTTLDEDKQLKLEEKLIKLKLIVRDVENPNQIKVDIQLLADITTNDNVKINNDDYEKYCLYLESKYRKDPTLIEVVEELGEKASGFCGELEIVKIPDNCYYKIDEYDGYESIYYSNTEIFIK